MNNNFVCLYSVDHIGTDIEDIRTEYGLIYANNFADAAEILERDIYGSDLIKINNLELLDTVAVFTESTYDIVSKELHAR
jgi:hypothetical protein